MRYRLRPFLRRLAAGPPIVETVTESYRAWRESPKGTRRTGFRFSIRDILWLMAVTGLAAGWWNDHRRIEIESDRWRRVNHAYEAKLRKLDYREQEVAQRELALRKQPGVETNP